MPAQDFSSEDLVTARLLELVDTRTRWNRSLWQAGSILALREVLEYAAGVRSGAIKIEGLKFVTEALLPQVERDLGLGTEAVRQAILELLRQGGDKNNGLVLQAKADELSELTRRGNRGYLRRWAKAVRVNSITLEQCELLARLAASHLLDAGFSPDHIHRWLKASSETSTLVELLEKGDDMCLEPAKSFNVLVPFRALPASVITAAGDKYLSYEDTNALIESISAPGYRYRRGPGSLKFEVSAREPWSAVEQTELEIRRLASRVVVGLAGEQVDPAGKAIVLGVTPRWRNLAGRKKDLLVSAISRRNLLLPAAREHSDHGLDDAIELLAAVETSTSWASVAAIWAAVEGLLTRAQDSGVTAADRMASVVTASFIRAELVELASALRVLEGPMAEIAAADGPRQLDRLLAALTDGSPLPAAISAVDYAAVERVRAAAAAPKVVHDRVQGYLRSVFRRLFQQRNQLLHGGRFDSVALSLTMRTTPVLVAAGMDRLINAVVLEEGATTLSVAARASNELRLLGSDGSRKLHRMLD
ncbi:hypothetical protein [Nocardioides zeae]